MTCPRLTTGVNPSRRHLLSRKEPPFGALRRASRPIAAAALHPARGAHLARPLAAPEGLRHAVVG
jgi:hypothetical protein